jgi:hypothetical protein
MERRVSEKKPLYESPGEKGKRGFMSYVRRQRAGSKEFGEKRIGESQTDSDVIFREEESD